MAAGVPPSSRAVSTGTHDPLHEHEHDWFIADSFNWRYRRLGQYGD